MDTKDQTAEVKTSESSESQVKKDFKNMTSAEQAKILKKHDPKAFAKIDREIAEKSEKFRKQMRVFTLVLAAILIYVLFIK